MKFSAAAVLAAAVAGASATAHSNVTYTTEVVDVYVTYCPYATELTHGAKTYTVTAPTTLTITDCPCTVTKPVYAVSSVVCHDCAKPTGHAYSNSTWVPHGGHSTAVATPISTPTGSSSSSSTSGSGSGSGSGSSTGSGSSPSSSTVPTGGAGKVAALSGAGLAAIVGLAAFL